MKINKEKLAKDCCLQIIYEEPHDCLLENMLKKNRPEGFLVPDVYEVGNQTIYRYTISGKESILDFHERNRMDAGEILLFLEDISARLDQLEEWLICPGQVLWDPDWIFYSKEKGVEICCSMVCSKNVNHAMEQLLSFLMKWMVSGSGLEQKKIYWLYKEIQKENAVFQHLMRQSVEAVMFEKELTAISEISEKKRFRFFSKKEGVKRDFLKEQIEMETESGDETIELNADLLEEKQYVHRLKRIGREMREDFPIYAYPATVGKAEEMDIVIAVPTVSNHHAQFQKTGERICVRDLGSLNGTYVNNVRIHEEVCLTSGDRVRFADQEYIFE